MTNLRMNQTLGQPTLSVTKPFVQRDDQNNVEPKLEERIALVKDGKENPINVLADLGVKNIQVNSLGNNRLNLTFEVNGKSVNVTGNSQEDIAEQAGGILGEEIQDGADGGPAKILGLLSTLFVFVTAIVFLEHCHPDIEVGHSDGTTTRYEYDENTDRYRYDYFGKIQ